MSADATTGAIGEIETLVAEVIAELGVDAGQIAREARLSDLELDSLDLAELAQVIYDRFEVEIVPGDAQQLDTVGDLIDAVEARR